MAISIKVKQEFETKVIGFNNSSLPLGKRNDLHILVEKAQKDKGRHGVLLNLFDITTIPEASRVEEEKVNDFEQKMQAKKDKKQTPPIE